MSSQAPVITIDGPSGSGSTVAGILARELGWKLLDSGALYRLLAFNAVNHGVDLTNEELLKALAAHLMCNSSPRNRVSCNRSSSRVRMSAT